MSELSAISVPWCDQAESLLQAIVTHGDIADIRQQVKEGALLFQVNDGPELIGYYVLRVDALASGCEGVIVAAAGRHAEHDLTELLVPQVEKQFLNCNAIRIHTSRPGLVKKLVAMGYEPQEFVLRKNL